MYSRRITQSWKASKRILKVSLALLTVASILLLSVPGSAPPAQAQARAQTIYDFIANPDDALWTTYDPKRDETYYLIFNRFGSEKGTAAWRRYPTLEDGSRPNLALDTHPIWVDQGRITGFYSGFVLDLQPGDRLVAKVGFRQGAGAGDVTYQVVLSYVASFSEWEDGRLWMGTRLKKLTKSVHDTYDGRTRELVITVPEEGVFSSAVLRVYAGETSAQDWAHWAEARLERPSDPHLQLRPKHSPSKCLDVDISREPDANGTKVQQWDCLGRKQANQYWELRPMGFGYYQIVSKYSGKCLDVDISKAPYANGTKVQQWDCLGLKQANQLWQLVSIKDDLGQGKGYFQLVAKHSGKCLDVDISRAPDGNGTKVQQWECLGARQANQLWRFRGLP